MRGLYLLSEWINLIFLNYIILKNYTNSFIHYLK